jgi:hypothetical protein
MSLIPTQSIRARWSKAYVEGYAAGVVIHELCDEVDSLRERIAALEAHNAKMREALEFYANEWRYEYDETCCAMTFRGHKYTGDDILTDHGQIARAALLPATTSGDGGETK